MNSSTHLKSFRWIAFSALLLMLSFGCSRAQKDSTQDLTSSFNFDDYFGGSTTGSNGNGSTQSTTPLSCSMFPETTEILVLGTATNGMLADAQNVNLHIFSTAATGSIQSLTASLPMQINTALPTAGSNLAMIPLALQAEGNYQITAVISDLADTTKTATCQTNILVRLEAPIVPTVQVLINGQDGPLSLPYNSTANLSWSSTHATNCQLLVNTFAPQSVSPTGNIVSAPLTENVAVSVRCDSASGVISDVVQVAISLPPSVAFTINGENNVVGIPSGGNLNLAWTSQGGIQYCVLYGTGLTPFHVPATGTYTVNNVADNRIYGLFCTDSQQIFSNVINVNINNPAAVIKLNGVVRNELKLFSKDTLTLSWNITNVTSCKLTQNGSESTIAAVGSKTLSNLITNQTFVFACTGVNGNINKTVKTLVDRRWYQADNQACPTFCAARGLQNIGDDQGRKCSSGEQVPPETLVAPNIIAYNRGCWKTCNRGSSPNTESVGSRCYAPGQKRDNDSTDYTMGCSCG